MRIALIFTFCVIVSSASFSAETTYELRVKADAEFKAADRALNEIYGKVMRDGDEARRKLLRDVQRAWIRFRDLECEFQYTYYSNGTLAPLSSMLKMTALTRKRTKELEEYLPH